MGQLAISRRQTDQAWMWNLLFEHFEGGSASNPKKTNRSRWMWSLLFGTFWRWVTSNPKKTNRSSMKVEFTLEIYIGVLF